MIVNIMVFLKLSQCWVQCFEADSTIQYTGLPLLYMGALTLPLGFVRTDHYRKYHPYDYGYEQA
jgi:hypothetical protein